MSYASLLIDTCNVVENTPGAANTYGHQADSWSVLHTAEPCRLVSARGREINVGAEIVIADYILFVRDITITEQHRVVIGSITYEILTVRNYQDGTVDHHKQCYLRTVR